MKVVAGHFLTLEKSGAEFTFTHAHYRRNLGAGWLFTYDQRIERSMHVFFLITCVVLKKANRFVG